MNPTPTARQPVHDVCRICLYALLVEFLAVALVGLCLVVGHFAAGACLLAVGAAAYAAILLAVYGRELRGSWDRLLRAVLRPARDEGETTVVLFHPFVPHAAVVTPVRTAAKTGESEVGASG